MLVPAFLKDCLRDVRAKVCLNTISLGEMNQDVVNGYMQFLHSGISTEYFYSINRYGNFPGGPALWPVHSLRVAEGADSYTTVQLDRDWDVLIWDLWGETSFPQIERASAPYLELLAKRVLRQPDDPLPRQKSLALYRAARQLEERYGAWHYYMWDSIRLFPARSPLNDYCRHLAQHDFPELELYAPMRDGTTQDFAPGEQAVHPVGSPPYLDRALPIAGEFVFEIEELRRHRLRAGALLEQRDAHIAQLEEELVWAKSSAPLHRKAMRRIQTAWRRLF